MCLRSPMETGKFFHAEDLEQLDPLHTPKHIAIIPDGNRRWAKKYFFNLQLGHQEGADTLMEIVEAAQELKIKVITFYSFSTENWNRPFHEVMMLMTLFTNYLDQQQKRMVNNGIKLETIGDLTPLPESLKQAITATKEATKQCDDIRLVLGFNYGSRDEICRSFHRLLEDYEQKKIQKEEINEAMISRYLDTREWSDPELFIRTSGELRLSNFLLWQISYAEIYVAPVLWPEFTPKHLLEAVLDFQNRQRRWGS